MLVNFFTNFNIKKYLSLFNFCMCASPSKIIIKIDYKSIWMIFILKGLSQSWTYCTIQKLDTERIKTTNFEDTHGNFFKWNRKCLFLRPYATHKPP